MLQFECSVTLRWKYFYRIWSRCAYDSCTCEELIKIVGPKLKKKSPFYLVFDLPPNLLEGPLLCFWERQLGWDRVTFRNQSLLLLLRQDQLSAPVLLIKMVQKVSSISHSHFRRRWRQGERGLQKGWERERERKGERALENASGLPRYSTRIRHRSKSLFRNAICSRRWSWNVTKFAK